MVNSRMKLDKPVPYNVTEAVHCVLEDLCSAASNRLDIEIDSRSLEVEPGEKFTLKRLFAFDKLFFITSKLDFNLLKGFSHLFFS